MGAILPSLAVRQDVSPADGHWLTHLADRLTWRQLIVLSIFLDPPAERLTMHDVQRDESEGGGPAPGLREEVEELGTLGLLGVTRIDGQVVRSGGTIDSQSSIWDTSIAQWQLTVQGRLLSEVARLDDT